MKLSKKGDGLVISDMVSLFFILFILALFIFYIFSGSLITGSIKSVIDAENKISAYNYYPSLITFLDTEINYDLNKDSIEDKVTMYEIVKDHLTTNSNREIIDEQSKEFFNNIDYCYYDDGKIRKVGFVLFLSNGEKWGSIENYKEWDEVNFDEPENLPVTFQQLTNNDYIYLYQERGIRANREECDNLE